MIKKLLLLLLIIGSPLSYGASDLQADNVLNFCGLNSSSSPFALKPCELSEAQNINFTLEGSVERRDGNALLGGQINANDVTAIYDFFQANGTQDTVAVAGTVISNMDSLDGTWDTVTGAVSLTADVLRDCEVISGTLYCTDGTSTDATWKYTGSGNAADWDSDFATAGSIEKAKYIALFHNYTILANVTLNGGTAHPSRFYWSDLGDPDTFRTTQFIDVEPNDRCGGIGAVEVLGERLVIMKERCGVYNFLFTGQSDIPFVRQKSLCDVGTDSGYTVEEVENTLLFYSRNIPGIYAYDGSACARISDRITPTIKSFDETTSSTMVAAIHPKLNQYWLSMRNSGSTENDRIIVYDFVNDAFSIHTGIEASFLNTINKSGEFKIYSGDYSGYVLEQDTGNSDVLDGTGSQTIDASVKTAWFPLTNPAMTKSLDHIMVYHSLTGNYNLSYGYSFDFETDDRYSGNFSVSVGGATWDAFLWDDGTTWASSGGGNVTRIDTTGAGAFTRIHFYNEEAVASWEVYGISPIFRLRALHRPSSFD